MDVSTDGKVSMYGVKDEMSRSGGWVPRDAARSRPDRGYESERALTPRPQAAGGVTNDSRPLGAPGREAGPPVDNRNHDRARKDGWLELDPRVEYDLLRDARLIQERISAQYGPTPARSTPAEAPVPIDSRRTSDIPPPAGDIRPPVDSRPPSDARADLHAVPARPAERVATDNNEDIGSSRSSSVHPPEASVPPPLGPVPSAVPAGDLVGEPPSLKDRIHPPSSHPSRNASEPPVSAGEQPQQPQQQPHPPLHGRSNKPQKFQKDRGHGHGPGGPPYDAPHRGGDRGYHRPPTPSGPLQVPSGGPIPPHRAYESRSASVDRPRVPPTSSPASRGPPREYRGPPGRDLSRPAGQSYRPDYHDDPRYDPRYEGRPYREYSPPPPPPLSLTNARGPIPGVEPPPSGRADYYPPRGRGWDEDDYFKSRGWDGPSPPGERGRYERDYPPPRSTGWDAREREYDPRGT